MTRTTRLLLAAVAIAGLAVPIGVGAAHADPLDAECIGTQTVTYTPGLTLVPTPQQVGINTIYAPCTSLSVPDLTSGTSMGSIQETLSCLDALQAGGGQRTITWNTGQTSTFAYNRTVTHAGGNTVATLTGTITAGLFAGDTAVEVIVGPTLEVLNCLTPPGITSRTGVNTLTITS